ncbi:MAG TPA: T9SS type A sorting domain-containing protein, partial [Ignavibacteriaceae bacterium]|nr:T9SS type A sorting domain-containing protein [Ignavibacteriaceae bacterium]
NGDTLWTRLFGSDGMDVFADLIVTPDSGSIAIGLTDTPADFENIYVVKLDKDGNTVFEKNFGGLQKDVAQSIAPAEDGGFVMTGGTKSISAGEEDLFLFKIDSQGDSLWFKTYGTAGNDPGYGISPASDGGFIVTGNYNWSDAWLLRVNAEGDTLWTKSFGGSNYEEANLGITTPDNGIIFCGSTSSYGSGELDAYLVKTDSSGNLLWQKTFGGTGYDEGRKIVKNPNGGYILLANTDSQIMGEFNYFIISTDENGDTLWTKVIGSTGGEDRAYGIQNISSNEYIIAGSTFDQVNLGEATLTLIKDDSAPSEIIKENAVSGFYLYNAYPNPFNPATTIKYTIGNSGSTNQENMTTLKIYDIIGNEITTLVNSYQGPGEYEVKFDASGLASGLYLCKLKSGNFVETRKLMLLK